jgi:hypothetical protein
MHDTHEAPGPARSRWIVEIDLRDVLAAIGALTVVAGALAFHWGLALMVFGAAVAGFAWRATR